MSIKAVAFDFGGVISLPQDEKALAELASLAGISADLLRRLYWKDRTLYDRGAISGETYFSNMLAEAGVFRDEAAIGRMVECDIQSWARINPETEALMRDVKKAGLKLGILSNMIRPFIDWARIHIPLFSLPDGAVYSCEVNTVKPEQKIYELLLDALGCAADELIFFDDMKVNVEGAAKLGIRGFLWESPANARREIELLCTGRF
ncbi:MAG: HAD family phosphatase [Treponema sp.]|jgi:putative hydrolase of the HAD superfamily|nr:HAD family phosphatase [Treponema sp.]